MAFYDDWFSGWTTQAAAEVSTGVQDYGSQFLSGVGSSIFGGGSQAPVPSYPMSGGFVDAGVPYMNTMGMVPALARGGAVVARGFFNRYPNLATAMQGLRNAGQQVSRAKLYSLLKRFGPEMLITGGILSGAAVSELMVAGPGRRRMNAGNVKALRRAHRRMKSFHHICQTNDTLLHHRRRKSASSSGSFTKITQVK